MQNTAVQMQNTATPIDQKTASKSIQTQILIQAPAEKVWKVLTDFSSYPDWNPFILKIEGKMTEGEKLKIELARDGKSPMKFAPKVQITRKNEHFEWLGHLLIPGIFDGRHTFELQQKGPNSTLFVHRETFSGLLSGPVFKSIREETKANFEAMNRALKTRCES